MEFDRADVLRFDPRTALVTPLRGGSLAAPTPRAGNEDQPRDDDGKWTDGGGGGGGAAGGGAASREGKAEKRARTKETARAARSAAKEAARAVAAVDKAEARIADLQKQADEAAETAALAIERAEAAEAEADEAEESVSDMRDWDPDDHDDEVAPTADDIAAAETLAREKRAAANRERKNADRADRRSDALEARAQEVEDGFEDDVDEMESEKDAAAEADDEHDYATIDELPARERETALRDRVSRSAETFRAATTAADADSSRHEEALAALAKREQRRQDDHAARLREADRVFRAGGDDWYERGNKLVREANAQDRAERRGIERDRRATLRANKAAVGDAVRAEMSRDFWANADDTDPETDGTAEDRDGDGLTGDEEEQDDEPESA